MASGHFASSPVVTGHRLPGTQMLPGIWKAAASQGTGALSGATVVANAKQALEGMASGSAQNIPLLGISGRKDDGTPNFFPKATVLACGSKSPEEVCGRRLYSLASAVCVTNGRNN